MKTLVVSVLALFLLGGCANYGTYKEAALIAGAKAMDEANDLAKVQECLVRSVGSLMRDYGDSPQKMFIWAHHCDYIKKPGMQVLLGPSG